MYQNLKKKVANRPFTLEKTTQILNTHTNNKIQDTLIKFKDNKIINNDDANPHLLNRFGKKYTDILKDFKQHTTISKKEHKNFTNPKINEMRFEILNKKKPETTKNNKKNHNSLNLYNNLNESSGLSRASTICETNIFKSKNMKSRNIGFENFDTLFNTTMSKQNKTILICNGEEELFKTCNSTDEMGNKSKLNFMKSNLISFLNKNLKESENLKTEEDKINFNRMFMSTNLKNYSRNIPNFNKISKGISFNTSSTCSYMNNKTIF